ncbi:MAG: tetratricopeptide repeat protein [Fluviicola sp.]
MKLLIRYYCIALLFIAPFSVKSQMDYKSFQLQTDLNIKSEMGMELLNYYVRFNLDSLKVAAIDLLLDASEHKHDFARAVGTRMLGSYLCKAGNQNQGLEYLTIAKEYFEKKEDYVIVSEICNAMGHAHLRNGSYDKAKEAYNQSLRMGEISNDATAAFNGKLGLGRVYIEIGDTASGMTIWHQYKLASVANEKYEAAADVYALMAQVEADRKNNSLSQEYYGRSIEFSKRSKSKSHIAHSYANEGIRKFLQKDYDSSLFYFEKSLEMRLELKAIRPILEGYYNMGAYYSGLDSLQKAVEYFDTGRKIAEEYKMWTDLKDFLVDLIDIYDSRENAVLKAVAVRRLEEVEQIIEEQSNAREELPAAIDLNFTSKKSADEIKVYDKGGVNWVFFVVGVLIGLALLFFFLERKRFS